MAIISPAFSVIANPFLLAGGAVWAVCFVYFNRQNQIMEQAILQINAYLDGDRNARIECDNEGELYRLFHSINSLAAVLNAHADNELREKEFLKIQSPTFHTN